MIKASNITLNVLVDYCNDTHFDLQETAKLFLESRLIQWEPCIPDENEEKIFGKYLKTCKFLTVFRKLLSCSYLTLEWIAKIIEDKNSLLKKCEDILCVISDKTDILDFLWNRVWEQVTDIKFLYLLFSFTMSYISFFR